jgi:hypothetical protein
MPHTTFIIVRSIFAATSFGLLGCSSDLVLPDSPSNAAQTIALTKVGGDGQNAAVGEVLAPLVVKVVDDQQHGLAGLSVAFQLSDPAGGIVAPDTATTNSDGDAVAQWTLGTLPGEYSVVARPVGVPGEDKAAEFHAIAEPGAPASLTPQTPLDQPGRRGQPVLTLPVVQVKDRYENPVPDVPVIWQVIAGEGQVTPVNINTDAEGKATAEWTLGDRIGVHKLTATVDGAGTPVTFTARVLF